MKIPLLYKKNRGAALLMVCMGAAILIGLPLTYYLTAVQGESATVARAQAWNNSMVLAEAGIEEGMSLVNRYANQGSPLTGWVTLTTPDTSVWSQSGNIYRLNGTRTLATGAGYYSVVVTNTSSTNVIIKATGIVPGANRRAKRSF